MKQSPLGKKWSRDPLTSYELDVLSDFASIAKFKSQKVWSRSADVCGNGEGKIWRGVYPPAAEIGLKIPFMASSSVIQEIFEIL